MRTRDAGPVAVGVDLAWGDRNRTGLAAVDPTGSLVTMDTVRTDDEIAAWMQTYAAGACLVAVDAPLVVNNSAGMRECERLLGRRFGARGASCYPSSRAMRHFADGGRAWRLAMRLQLDARLTSTAPRRILEVYPHAAIVELFGLPTVLRYKRGRGRSVADRRGELLRLIALVDSLADADPALRTGASAQWTVTHDAVRDAVRPMHLNAVEDAVDAVLCAYVARLVIAAPHRVEHLGTDAEGAITVPCAMPD